VVKIVAIIHWTNTGKSFTTENTEGKEVTEDILQD